MEEAERKHAVDAANGSGFLFQLAVKHRIEEKYAASRDPDRPFVLPDEYPWTDADGNERFIDLIVSRGDVAAVIECKRVQGGGRWVFPVVAGRSAPTGDIRAQWAGTHRGSPRAAVRSFSGRPQSVSSQFCHMRGSDKKQAPLLERVCGTLLRSTEAFAAECLRIGDRAFQFSCFLPVIVTNAQLAVCEFEPSAIDGDGRIAAGQAEVHAAPFVRFHKPLTSKFSSASMPRSIRDAAEDRERTVFVVNSEHLLKFLEELRVY